MRTELAYRTTSEAAVEWFVTNERTSCSARRALNRFEAEVTSELGPVPGTAERHLVHIGGRVIGVQHGEGEAIPDGMKYNKSQNAFVPHPVDFEGRIWRTRISDLPRVPDKSTASLIGVPWQTFADGEFRIAKVSAEKNSAGEVIAVRQEWESRESESACLRMQSLRDDIDWVKLTTLEPFLP